MAHLTLVGMSGDKTRLLLVDDAGHEFTLDADDQLRAALRGDRARLGQLEIQMESSLRPRDIQARIRAGESPDQVAQAAGTTADKIMVYAGPVLAERSHMAERAQRASIRRTAGEPAARTLGDAVAAQLRQANVPGDSLEWDAWRREDGRWSLAVPLPSAARAGAAHFTFDPRGNYVVAEDDHARWLVGDLPEPEARTRDDLRSARQRRLVAVPADELPLGDDALELVADDDTEDLTETASRLRAAPHADTLGEEPPAEAFLDTVFARQNPPDGGQAQAAEPQPVVDGAAAVADQTLAGQTLADQTLAEHAHDEPTHHESTDEDSTDEDPADEDSGPPHEPPHRREVKKTRGRASVPTWDEIMFGGGSSD